MLTKKGGKIYLIGIKGTGMSSLAVLLKKMGYRITGSDTPEKFFTESQLKSNKISFYEGYAQANLMAARPNLVICSTAYGSANPEIAAAQNLKLKVLTYPQAVGVISAELDSIAICGSHGKTTTTSMLGWVMQANQQTVTLTGTVADSLNRQIKKPKFFVFEADEYQNKLALYSPRQVILTNVDYDHPDFFKTKTQYNQAFANFAQRILKNQGYLLYNRDNTLTQRLLQKVGGSLESYGYAKKSTYVIRDVNPDLNAFTIFRDHKKIIALELKVYGRHNILNATAAAILALKNGLTPQSVRQRLKSFGGVKRRLELIPSRKYLILDDYGHHPTEIQAALAAVRNKYPTKKIITVFHPHTFTRTKTLLKEFGQSFAQADLVIVLDIYGSAREVHGTIHASQVVKEIQKNQVAAIHLATIPEVAAYIQQNIPRGSLILTIGAGDVWKLCDLIK